MIRSARTRACPRRSPVDTPAVRGPGPALGVLVMVVGAVFATAGCSGPAADEAGTLTPASASVSPPAVTPPSDAPVPVAATTEAVPSVPTVDVVALDLAPLEAELGVRVGVYVLDTGTGRTVEHRADERFAYASTFKALAAGALLATTTDEQMQEPVTIDAGDLVTYSPVTERRVGSTMTMAELAAAAVQVSDNTAANLVLERLGGPAGLEQEIRSLGDTVTEVERTEPTLNEAVPGDPRDTSTPRALATDLAAYAVGDAISEPDRAVLTGWLETSTTGATLVRAGVPAGWVVASKSGSGRYGTRNDIAVVHPPGRAPLVVAVMSDRTEEDAERLDEAVARAARLAVEALDG